MSTAALAACLIAGAGAWLLAGRLATGSLRLDTSPYWAVPMVAGAAAVTVLAQLDPGYPAFARVAPRAAVFWVISAGLFGVAALTGPNLLVRVRWPVAFVALALQLGAYLTGSSPAGKIQMALPLVGTVVVSEIVRVLLIVATASVVARLEPILDQPLRGPALRPLMTMGGFWLLSALLSFAAKDTGAAALTLVVLAVAAMFVLGRPGPTLAILTASTAGVAAAAVTFPHAFQRIASFMSPPAGSRIDQARMALYASSSGRMTGHRSGGQDLQYVGSTLDDDFLLAAVGRVLGLTGVVAVVLLILTGAVACLRPLELSGPYGFRRWVSVYASALLGTQLILSVGGVYGLVPATGVPVPFMTGSGTSLMAAATLMGIAAAAQRTTNQRTTNQRTTNQRTTNQRTTNPKLGDLPR